MAVTKRSTTLLLVLVVLTSYTDCFVLDSASGPKNSDPLLTTACQPLSKPSHGRIYCVYSAVNLTCEATCDVGYHFDDNAKKNVLTCSKDRIWPQGTDFPKCHRICLQHISDCIGREDGDYPSCKGCTHYVTCARDGASDRECPPALEFDNSVKRCAFRSTTCI